MYDPQRLIFGLETIQDNARSWVSRCAEVVQVAGFVLNEAGDLVTWASRRTGLAEDFIYDLRLAIQQADDDVRRMVHNVDFQQRDSDSMRSEGQRVSQRAAGALRYWRHELSVAEAWLRKAEEELRRALIELRKAEEAEARAESRLRAAEANLERCESQSDDDDKDRRRDCSSERWAVAEAQQELAAARLVRAAAQAEVNRAQREVDAARARVLACQEAIQLCLQATASAEAALSAVNLSDSYVASAREATAEAEGSVERAEEINHQQQDNADRMRAISRDMSLTLDQALQTHLQARRAEESAKTLTIGMNLDLDQRIMFLQQFDSRWDW